MIDIQQYLDQNNLDFFYLLGVVFGDGCLYVNHFHSGSSYQLSITSSDTDLCKTCSNICLDLFDKAGKIKLIFKDEAFSYAQLVICSKDIVLWLRDFTCNRGSISSVIWGVSSNCRKAFLMGMMDSDGWITKINPSDGFVRYRVGFSNTALWAPQIHDGLSNLGVTVGRLRYIDTYRYKKKTKKVFTFSINTKDFLTKIGFRIKRKRLLAQEYLDKYDLNSKVDHVFT